MKMCKTLYRIIISCGKIFHTNLMEGPTNQRTKSWSCFLYRNDATAADSHSPALDVQKSLQETTNYKGGDAEKQARIFLATFGIGYDAITNDH